MNPPDEGTDLAGAAVVGTANEVLTSSLSLTPTALEDIFTCVVAYSDFPDNKQTFTLSVATLGKLTPHNHKSSRFDNPN